MIAVHKSQSNDRPPAPQQILKTKNAMREMTHFRWLDVVAFGNLLVELFDISEARDESGGRAVRLLTMEDQFGLRDFGCRRRSAVTARRRVVMT